MWNRQIARLMLVALGVALWGVLVRFSWAQAQPPAKPDTRESARVVPLDQVYATCGQAGMIRMSHGYSGEGEGRQKKYANPYGPLLEEISIRDQSGAANIFLVRGNSITDAVTSAHRTLVGYRSAEKPVCVDDKLNDAPIWAVFSLGFGFSIPAKFIVDSIAVDGTKVSVTYHEPKPTTVTMDLVRYLYCAPLGKLEPGIYSVELHNSDTKLISIMRQIVVD